MRAMSAFVMAVAEEVAGREGEVLSVMLQWRFPSSLGREVERWGEDDILALARDVTGRLPRPTAPGRWRIAWRWARVVEGERCRGGAGEDLAELEREVKSMRGGARREKRGERAFERASAWR